MSTPLTSGPAAELADQILRIRKWETTPHGQIARNGQAIHLVAHHASVYAPGTAPGTTGRILMGIAAILAHIPDCELATACNLIAAAGADLIAEGEDR